MNTSDITRTLFILWMFTMLQSFSKISLEMRNNGDKKRPSNRKAQINRDYFYF